VPDTSSNAPESNLVRSNSNEKRVVAMVGCARGSGND